MDHKAGREALSNVEDSLVAALGPPSQDIEEYYHTLTTSSGWQTTVKVWRPAYRTTTPRTWDASSPSTSEPMNDKNDKHNLPLILLFHGGGFAAGSVEMLTRPGREFALAFDAVVVCATYRLAPEHPFPASVHDTLDVAAWMSLHAEETLSTCLSPSEGGGFVIGGFSAGAQAAAVVASEARREQYWTGGDPKPTALFLGIPSLLVKEIVPPRYQANYTSHILRAGATTPEALDALRKALKPDVHSPLFSPFNSPVGLAGMPRTYIQVGYDDPLRDDGVILAAALDEVGVEVWLDGYDALGHEGFTIWWHEDHSRKDLKENTMKGLAWLLRRET